MVTKELFHHLPPKARILFIRLRSMGDCLLLTAPIRALKEQFPKFRITVLVEPQFVDCFDANPDVDEILTRPNKLSFAGPVVRAHPAGRLFRNQALARTPLRGPGPTLGSAGLDDCPYGRRGRGSVGERSRPGDRGNGYSSGSQHSGTGRVDSRSASLH